MQNFIDKGKKHTFNNLGYPILIKEFKAEDKEGI